MSVKKSTNTKGNNITKEEATNGKGLSVIAYLGVFALIPYFTEKKNKFVRFHAVQGLNLFIIELIVSVCLSMLASFTTASLCANNPLNCVLSGGLGLFGFLGFISWATGIIILALTILGIVYAVRGQAKELPIINNLKIIKK